MYSVFDISYGTCFHLKVQARLERLNDYLVQLAGYVCTNEPFYNQCSPIAIPVSRQTTGVCFTYPLFYYTDNISFFDNFCIEYNN
jgi:hypothetical protein